MKKNLTILDQTSSAIFSSDKLLRAPVRGAFIGRAAVVTLGCAKNQVDSEVMLGVLARRGFQIVSDLDLADVAIVNTCGFLQSSIEESLQRIVELADLKSSGRLRKLIVAGCLVERFKGELRPELEEVDSFVSVDEILNVGALAAGETAGDLFSSAERPYFIYDEKCPRILSTPSHYGYVKISEGCDRPCAFCIIPKLRGRFRSRSQESILSEIALLARSGVKEFNLVAQDLTAYGDDLGGGYNISSLLRAIGKQGVAEWVRLLYTYPLGISEELLSLIKDSERICKYLDIPLQHSSLPVIKAMRRPAGRFAPRQLVEFVRANAPEIKLRTTFIVGFPGESERDVEDLCAFVGEGHFESVGVFTYSAEEGTPAAEMSGRISEAEKEARKAAVMLAQRKVWERKAFSLVGGEMRVLVDGAHEESDLLISARAEFQAPEVDGVVIINNLPDELLASGVDLRGKFARVRVSQPLGYDLVAECLKIED
ncbi:MAG TPA: 30S ribosomal protein S12 methylthiotransferase RimO [Oligoflexia bacterium]|mgnify:CR=1 FL=1|nr:30S ribosomal protein S12 methylthiotransferase RimO [Oligoflexia bacterium]HMP27779.1 30S ribosomal protein S12 methylthiotransferase RimO [Oligoflexia bacterium]